MTGCGDSESFALRVVGDSMAPEFVDGEIIIVEPTTELTDGCFVVAEHDGEALFRRLDKDGDDWLLTPLNARYPRFSTRIECVRGRVVAKSGRRGRPRRHYL